MYIGIDLGGSHIGIGCVTPDGKIIKEYQRDLTAEDKLDAKKIIFEDIVNVLKKWEHEDGLVIEKIGLAIPGIVKDNQIVHTVNLGVDNWNIACDLKAQFPQATINAKNDAKCAAMAEKNLGALTAFKDCVFMCIGTGIGGAAFYNNQMINPKRSPGFEFGHMTIQRGGNVCRCGNSGCFETYGSMKKFKSDVRNVFNLDDKIEGRELAEFVQSNIGNDEMIDIIEEYTNNLCIGISNIINILEPEAICLGGGFVHYKNILLEKLINKIKETSGIFYKENMPTIVTAELGNNAGIIGSALFI